jgi:hypothetical protein
LLHDDPTDDDLRDPEHWRRLAQDAREKADGMSSSVLKERMQEIAVEYDRLARVRADQPPSVTVLSRINGAAAYIRHMASCDLMS